MKVKITKTHSEATIPSYAKPGDAGMDLKSTSATYEDKYITYGTGLAVEIPEGYVGLLFPRSSVYRTGQLLANSVGVIDSGYRGEIKLKFTRSSDALEYNVGDRVGQLIILPYPKVDLVEVENLDSTSRGAGGFGSTGR